MWVTMIKKENFKFLILFAILSLLIPYASSSFIIPCEDFNVPCFLKGDGCNCYAGFDGGAIATGTCCGGQCYASGWCDCIDGACDSTPIIPPYDEGCDPGGNYCVYNSDGCACKAWSGDSAYTEGVCCGGTCSPGATDELTCCAGALCPKNAECCGSECIDKDKCYECEDGVKVPHNNIMCGTSPVYDRGVCCNGCKRDAFIACASCSDGEIEPSNTGNKCYPLYSKSGICQSDGSCSTLSSPTPPIPPGPTCPPYCYASSASLLSFIKFSSDRQLILDVIMIWGLSD